MVRFKAQPGASLNEESYPVTEGNRYSAQVNAYGTAYMFVGALAFSSNFKFYRIQSGGVTDVKEFTVGTKTQAYGVIFETTRVLASTTNTDKRKIFDYTGSDSTVAEHTKVGSHKEVGFISLEDGRDYYVVTDAPNKLLRTLRASDGDEHLTRNLNTDLSSFGFGLAWVYDTDLAVVVTHNNKMAIYDFMDTSSSRRVTPVTLSGSSPGPKQVMTWVEKRSFIVPRLSSDVSDVYKIAVKPCSDLCTTCHEVNRKQCSNCKSNSSPKGTSCSCDAGYYQSQVLFTLKECLACSPLCGTCSGGATTNCLTCQDANMEVKGGGSCGCKDGFILSGSSCFSCHSSCLTCSAGDQNSCLSCRTSGWFQVGSSCRICDSSYYTCSGPTSNDCLSCSEAGFFLKSSSCMSCAAEASSDCPRVTSLTIQSQIQELTRTLELDFSPSLKDQLTNANQISLFSVKNLLKNNLKITYGKDENSQTEITIMETRMSHSDTNGNGRLPDQAISSDQNHSYVYISFFI